MTKKKEEGIFSIEESDPYNIAKGFVTYKLLMPLIELDKYVELAIYGTREIEEYVPDNMISQNRINALRRLKDKLILLIENCRFAIKKADHEKLNDLKDELNYLGSQIDSTFEKTMNQQSNTETITIKEDRFAHILLRLREIKEQVNTPINSAGLIFKRGEEYDFDRLERELVEGG